jgi:hypothetical protein
MEISARSTIRVPGISLPAAKSRVQRARRRMQAQMVTACYVSFEKSAEERTARQNKMMSAKSYDKCKAIQDQHHKAMEVRAKEKGLTLPARRQYGYDRMKARTCSSQASVLEAGGVVSITSGLLALEAQA